MAKRPKRKPQASPPQPQPQPQLQDQPQSSSPPTPRPKLGTFQRVMEMLPGSVRNQCAKIGGNEDIGGEKPLAPILAPEGFEYQRLAELLPADIRESLVALRVTKPRARWPHDARWCICEVRDGDFARVRLFTAPENLARYMSRLVGEEVQTPLFYGTPLRISMPDAKFSRRYMELPGGCEAMLIPRSATELPVIVPITTLQDMNVEWETESWIGPKSLDPENEDYFVPAEPLPSRDKPGMKALPPPAEEEDEDEGDEGTGDGVPRD